MQRALMATAGAVLAVLATAAAAQAQTRVEVGVLTCTARGSTGFIIGSSRELRCRFVRQGRDEFYSGTIDKFGIDIGSHQAGHHLLGRAGADRPTSRRARSTAPMAASARKRPSGSASAPMR